MHMIYAYKLYNGSLDELEPIWFIVQNVLLVLVILRYSWFHALLTWLLVF